MITPKEKAKELVEKYFNIQEEIKWTNDDTIIKKYQEQYEEQSIEVEPYWKLLAKQCALIAVEELIQQQEGYNNGSFYPNDYWKRVKQEIELL
jgi:hypothetical protein